MAPVTRFTCRATVLARPPSIVAVWRLSLVLHVELLCKPVHHLLSLYGACHSYYRESYCVSPSSIYCRCMAPVTRMTCRATVLARPPSIVALWRLSLVLHVELLC